MFGSSRPPASEGPKTAGAGVRGGVVALAMSLAVWLAGPGQAAAQETGRIAGSVNAASTMEPLSGVQVSVRGTGLGTLTEDDGQFSIRGVPTGEQTVVFRLIGYSVQRRTVQVQAGQTTTVEIELGQQALEMEQIVVTGTAGGARRREIGNTVSQISAEEIEDAPANRVADVLQGRSSGTSVLENSGQVGAGTTIRIRGNNSLSSNNPLVYVDGMRVSSGSSGAYEDEVNQSVNFLDAVNPEDIDRVEIVKGPAATTLYGTEASGGVIQIFTKSGANVEVTRWSAKVEQGMNVLPRIGPENDPSELGMTCSETEPEPPGCPARGSYDRPGHAQTYSLSVRGGTGGFDYYTSGNFSDENGVIPPQGAQSYNVRGNFGYEPSSALRFQFNTFVSSRNITWVPDGNNAEGFLLNTFRGDAGYAPDNENTLTLDMGLETSVENITTGLNMTWNPGGGVTQSLKAGMDHNQTQYQEDKPFGFFTEPRGNRESDEFLERTLTLDYTGNWRTDFAEEFSSTFSWGGQLFHEHSRRLDGYGEGFAGPGPKLTEDGADTEIFDEDHLTVVEGGAFFQEQVGWNDQLFVTAGVRIDGNSAFGEDFGAEVYPKIQGSYMLSDNEFWPEWWNTMKLRAALGKSGTAPGPFDQLRTWGSVGVSGQPGVTPGNVGNPDLGPEVTNEWEAGFESSFADGRVTGQFTYYDQKTSDALVGVQSVPSTGFISTQLENVGELKNSGIEASANVDVIRADALSWSVGGQFSTFESEALDLGPVESVDVPWRQEIVVGHPVPVMVQERVRNPDAAWDEAEFADDSIIGPTMPTRSWSLNTNVTVAQRLTFRAVGDFQGGHYLSSGTAYQNVRRGAWPGQPEGTSATCPEIQERADAGNTDGLTALDRALCDVNGTSYGMWTWPADFFKLRSASLTYQIPQSVLPGGIRGAKLNIAGRNLFKITDYPGVDPEAFEDGSAASSQFRQEYYNLPPLRSFTASLSLNW